MKGQSNISKLTLSSFLLVEEEKNGKSLSGPENVSLTALHIFKLFSKIDLTFCILYKITLILFCKALLRYALFQPKLLQLVIVIRVINLSNNIRHLFLYYWQSITFESC